ncbi:Riboflavin transporter [Roseovarius albus]|uniref:Riboflavin transporter n=1 Tax=Roseovarius albus TaxID=1247867 RepID=A0A1X6YSQ1_9RHOB|nr:DMT family transporter [Roseovarius albus]SLN28288.1 Riboflavin transporter [Roseovarius albus]
MSAALRRANLLGAMFGMAAVFCFSLNDLWIKQLSDNYALHQVVLIRACIGTLTFFAFVMPFNGGFRVFRTRRPSALALRGMCAVLANTFLFLGLWALPIADAVAIFFVSPLIITLMSVFILRETVGPRRWAAVIIGLIGVLIIIRPGTEVFQIASIFPILAATLYSCMHIIARRIGQTESAATMAIYTQLSLVLVASLVGLALGDGRMAASSIPALELLFRAWTAVDPADYLTFLLLGSTGMMGSFLISQAFRLGEAAFVAPMEYIAMPMAIFWGVTFFNTWPDGGTWIGIALILGSGLYMVWRETLNDPPDPA